MPVGFVGIVRDVDLATFVILNQLLIALTLDLGLVIGFALAKRGYSERCPFYGFVLGGLPFLIACAATDHGPFVWYFGQLLALVGIVSGFGFLLGLFAYAFIAPLRGHVSAEVFGFLLGPILCNAAVTLMLWR